MSLSAVRRRIRFLHEKEYKPPIVFSAAEIESKQCLESSFHEFVKWSWNLIEGIPFVDGWHIEAMCEHLELAFNGEINSLVINVPPRTMKSTLLSMFTAWSWTKEPHLKFLCVSGTKSLAVKDNLRCRRIVESREYQKFWGDKVTLRSDSNSKQRFENTAGGHRLAYSMNSSVRGEGGNFVIVDDGNTDQDAVSDVMRESKNEYLDFSLSLRISDSKRMCQINTQQRVHQFDLTGHILSKDFPVIHLRLPMEFEAGLACQTIPLRKGEPPWRDPRTKEGELLWPEGLPSHVIKKFKADLRTEYNIAGQLQQRPSPRHGGLIKKEWFKKWERVSPPETFFKLQSWDTAITINKDSCYSACTTWGVFQDDDGYNNLVLLNAWRGKLEYPDLKEMMLRSSEDYKCQDLNSKLITRRPDMVLVEKGANGMSLIQDLFRSGLRVVPFDPKHHGFRTGIGTVSDSSKVGRAKIASSIIEQGFVWLLLDPRTQFRSFYPHANMFLEATTNFPRGDGADLVDSMSQALIKLMQSMDLNYRGQKPDEPMIDWKTQARQTSRLLEKNSNLYSKV